MTQVFAPGDLVQLKSGGEKMTVEEVNGNEIACVWFEGKKLNRQAFVAATLIRYEPPSGTLQIRRS